MNIEIKNINNELVVDSRIVASGFEIEHESLVRNLKKYFPDLISEKSKSTGGRPEQYFLLTKRITLAIPSIVKTTPKTFEFQLALVDAFLAMENAALNQLPSDPKAQALMLATQLLASEKQIQKLEGKIEENQTKVDYANRVLADDTLTPIGIWGKQIGIGEKRIFDVLESLGYLKWSSQANRRIPYAKYEKYGFDYLRTKAHPNDERWITIYITGKGKIAIHEHMTMEGHSKYNNYKLL